MKADEAGYGNSTGVVLHLQSSVLVVAPDGNERDEPSAG